jgi:large subunit ribosomal protein L29
MKISELRELSQGELVFKVVVMEKDLFKLKFQHGIRQLENTAKLPLLKQDIARVKTVISQKSKNA